MTEPVAPKEDPRVNLYRRLPDGGVERMDVLASEYAKLKVQGWKEYPKE